MRTTRCIDADGRHRARRADAGFSLIEVMIALVLLLIGMTGVALAQLQALRAGANSGDRSRAMYLAEAQLETFQAMWTLDPTVTTPGPAADPNNPLSMEDLGPADPTRVRNVTSYFRCWNIQPNTPVVGLTTITVEVRVGDPNCNAAAPQFPFATAVRVVGVK